MHVEYSGRGSICEVEKSLKLLSAKRVFIVTGKRSFYESGAKAAIEKQLANYQATYFSNFTANPNLTEALSGTELFRNSNSETIVAIGGGSAIDIAKSISAFHGQRGKEYEIAIGALPVESKDLPPIIAIPTTAGTGSEATHFAVIYVNGVKYSIASPHLIPRVSILDPTFTDNLNPYITACTALDALCQSIESHWSFGANNESLSYSSAAISILIDAIDKNISSPINETTREKLLDASNLAGKAINISKTTAPHALSYEITSKHALAHGHAVALTLGAFLEFHNQILSRNISGLSVIDNFPERHSEICRALRFNQSDSLVSQWNKLIEKCGLKTSAATSIFKTYESRNHLISRANLDRLGNHPIKLNESNLHKILALLA